MPVVNMKAVKSEMSIIVFPNRLQNLDWRTCLSVYLFTHHWM